MALVPYIPSPTEPMHPLEALPFYGDVLVAHPERAAAAQVALSAYTTWALRQAHGYVTEEAVLAALETYLGVTVVIQTTIPHRKFGVWKDDNHA